MTAPLAEIQAIVREILRNDDIELTRATQFDNVPCWDSMDLVTVVVEVECRFGVDFDLEELDRLFSVGDLIDRIEAKLALATA